MSTISQTPNPCQTPAGEGVLSASGAVKIISLEMENVKRVKAVKIKPSASGLTIIGGRNNQGKTSVLDAIAWGLGGDRFRPTDAQREGSVIPPMLHFVLSNGLIVERKGKNGDLKVIDPEGRKGGQQILNEVVEALALDLPRFMQSNNRDKADVLLRIIGVGDKLYELEQREKETYSKRHAIGQIADQKKKFAAEMPLFTDAPKDLISASELIRQQQDILARNGENQRKRVRLNALTCEVDDLRQQIAALQQRLTAAEADLSIARRSAEELHDESTAELEGNIANIETINRKVRANLDREKAEEDALAYENQYRTLSTELTDIRREKADLLERADLPLPGLSVEDGELIYHGRKWDCMSGSEQLRVAAAIVRKLNPRCGFVLMDKLEQLDSQTLEDFGAWLEQEGLQVIATRVGTGGECAIVIEDGIALEPEPLEKPVWKAGAF